MTIASTFVNASRKSCAISARTFLALEVVSVVVTGGKNVGAEHDAALHFGAKARAARFAVHAEKSGIVNDAEP